MKVVLSPEEWKRRRLFVATPMYGGQCTGHYTQSMLHLQKLCDELGIALSFNAVVNESLITRARNQLVHMFLETDCTHLMFIDADIGFRAGDVIRLLGLTQERSGFDVLSGSYPVKRIDWQGVQAAAQAGAGPGAVENAGNVFVSRPAVDFDAQADIVAVDYAATGFMMTARSIFDRLRAHRPEEFYVADFSSIGLDGDTSRRVHMFFNADIDHATKRYLPEDYWFCQRVREAGGRIAICPGMEFSHVGMHVFKGSLREATRRPDRTRPVV